MAFVQKLQLQLTSKLGHHSLSLLFIGLVDEMHTPQTSYSSIPDLFETLIDHKISSSNPLAFFDCFGLSLERFKVLEEVIYYPHSEVFQIGQQYICDEERLLLFLNYVRTKSSFHSFSMSFGFAKGTVRSIFQKSISSLLQVYKQKVVFPSQPTEILGNDKKFIPFRGAFGAIDGCHCAINPTMIKPEEIERWQNRKGVLSTNVLVCCSFGSVLKFK